MDRMLAASPRGLQPTTCLFAARALPDFGDGFIAALLPFYLLELGLSPLEVGIVATTSMLGSACLTIGVGLLGARYGQRQRVRTALSQMDGAPSDRVMRSMTAIGSSRTISGYLVSRKHWIESDDWAASGGDIAPQNA